MRVYAISLDVRIDVRNAASGVSITPSFALCTIIFALLPWMIESTDAVSAASALRRNGESGKWTRPAAPAAPANWRNERRSMILMTCLLRFGRIENPV